MKKTIFFTVMSLTFGSALADSRAWESDRRDRGVNMESRSSGVFVDYAKVVGVVPFYREVSVPHQVCNQETVYEQRHVYSDRNSPAGMIVGGVVGSHIGKGKGKTVATVLGAITGSVVGNNVARGNGYESYPRNVSVCKEVYSYRNEVDGYDVTYAYNNSLFTTRMPYDPGNKVKIKVNIFPIFD